MSSKRQTTFAKMDRERTIREKRERKREKKEARKAQAAAEHAGDDFGAVDEAAPPNGA